MTTQTTFSCRFCGRIYPLQSELMGRSIRCKCGRPILVPGVRQKSQTTTTPVDEGNFLRCPQCENRIPAGEYICAECNFNLRTGQIEEPVAEPAAPSSAAAMPPSLKSPQTKRYDDQQKRTTILLACGFLALVLVTLAGIWLVNRRSAPATSGPLPAEDALVQEMLQTDAPREAIEWLAVHPSRMFSGMTRSQADDRVRMLYSLGAKQVLAFGSGMTTAIAVELPDEADRRLEIFQWQERWHKQHRHRVWEDVGQKYLLIRLGI
jgi:DNA-directed RNA polymerase subunit RPC12/RpoP